jgi:hypothetical protein
VLYANPGDIVADGLDLPALEAGRRDHHGEVGLAAGAGEGRGDVCGFAFRRLYAEDKHVLGHPAFVACDVAGDAQREALLSEQRVAAVAGSVAPDLACFGEVDDVLGVILRPGNVLLAGLEWRADRVHARHNALGVAVNLCEDRSTDPRHDAHIHDRVGGVRELYTDLRHGRSDGAHRVGKHIHGAAAHGATKELLQLLAHDEGVFPVVGGAGVVFGE